MALYKCGEMHMEKVMDNAPKEGHGLQTIVEVDGLFHAGMGFSKDGDIVGWLDRDWFNLSVLESVKFGWILNRIATETEHGQACCEDGYGEWLSRLLKALRDEVAI